MEGEPLSSSSCFGLSWDEARGFGGSRWVTLIRGYRAGAAE